MTEDRIDRLRTKRELRERSRNLRTLRKKFLRVLRRLRRQAASADGWKRRMVSEELRACESAVSQLPSVAEEFSLEADGLPGLLTGTKKTEDDT